MDSVSGGHRTQSVTGHQLLPFVTFKGHAMIYSNVKFVSSHQNHKIISIAGVYKADKARPIYCRTYGLASVLSVTTLLMMMMMMNIKMPEKKREKKLDHVFLLCQSVELCYVVF